MKKNRHIFLKILAGFAGLWIILLVAVQITLRPAVLQKIINSFASTYIDGALEFKDLDISVIKGFPNLNVRIDSLSITYPSELFPDGDSRLTAMGKGETRDTLLSFERMSATVNILSLLREQIIVPGLELSRPRVFVHNYNDTLSNLSILKFLAEDSEKDESDTDTLGIPSIQVGKASLDRKPLIVYTSVPDSLEACLVMKSMALGSDFDVAELLAMNFNNILFQTDSMKVFGHLGKERLAFLLDNLRVQSNQDKIDLALNARARAYSPSFGHIRIPISLDGSITFPEQGNFTNVDVSRLDASIADIPLKFKGKVNLKSSDRIYVNADASISSFKLKPFLLDMPSVLPLKPSQISSDATLSMSISAKGEYSPTTLPDVKAQLTVKNLKIDSPQDTIHILLDSLGISAKTRKALATDKVTKGEKIFDIAAAIDTVNFDYKGLAKIAGKNAVLSAQASQRLVSESILSPDSDVIPVFGELSLGRLILEDDTGMALRLRNSDNSFSMKAKAPGSKVPVLDLESSTGSVAFKAEEGRIFIRGLDLDATAAMNSIERRQRMRAVVDSLAKAHPDTPRDSLFRYLPRRHSATTQTEVSEYLKSKDLRLDLGETFKKYFREWDFNAGAAFSSLRLMTPLFPLKISATETSLSIDNDAVRLNSLSMNAGHSSLKTTGSITGIRPMLLRNRGTIKADLSVKADSLDVDELLTAYSIGIKSELWGSETSDAEAEKLIEDSMAEADSTYRDLDIDKVIIIPGNIAADVQVAARNVKYAPLLINSMHTKIEVKDRKAKMLRTTADTSVGEMEVEASYSSADVNELMVGMYLNLRYIAISKVIELIPQVDTLLPMIKSLDGMVGFKLAARTKLDSLGNFSAARTDGVASLSGRNIRLKDTEEFEKILRMMKFDKPDQVVIPQLKMNIFLKDENIQICPVPLELDRYKVAVGGNQTLDMDMDYHISVIESPMVFKLGANIYGPVDDFKFKMEKPQFKKWDQIPNSTPEASTRIDEIKAYINQ